MSPALDCRRYPRGTVADSMPRYENNVRAIAARIALVIVGYSGGTVGAKLVQLAWNRPSVPIATKGTSLRTVVTVWSRPAPCTPRRLTNVSSQTRPDRHQARQLEAAGDCWEERADVAQRADRHRRDTRPQADPVAPGDQKAGKIAKGDARIGIRSAGLGHLRRQAHED